MPIDVAAEQLISVNGLRSICRLGSTTIVPLVCARVQRYTAEGVDMQPGVPAVGPFVARVTAAHVIAYFLAGLAALASMQYEERFATDLMAVLMRPIDEPIVAAGAGFQLINGLALGLVLAPFRRVLVDPEERGTRHLFVLLVGLSLFSPQTPGPGNLEGVLYTRIPWAMHLASLPEVFAYAALLSVGLVWWCRDPVRWKDRTAGALVSLVVVMSALGVMDALGWLPAA